MKFFVFQLTGWLLTLLIASCAYAQVIEARVTSLNGGSAARTNNGNVFKLKAGDALKPGDVIDTRGGAQVLIEMTDGSVVIVRPGSQVVRTRARQDQSFRRQAKSGAREYAVGIHCGARH